MKIPRGKKLLITKESRLRDHMCRGREGYNDLEWLMPFVILGGKLHETERVRLWDEVYGFVRKVERNHFHRRFQVNKDYTDQRVILFYELCTWKWERNISWCCKTFIQAFPHLECILMLRRWGVGGVELQHYTGWGVKAIVTYLTLYRNRETYDQWWIRKMGRPPNSVALKNWQWKSRWVENLIGEHLLTQFIEGVRSELEYEAYEGDEDFPEISGED